MEVADQWRREWAGTAEYGKVVEGGVTRQIARAMEVLHASGPGARVRVMRAAYHSSAGPGAPASSYMLHSSRRVISSGFNFMDPPSLPSKPLEISSVPLEFSQDSPTEVENYKVTEPDDTEISEPSKWRSSLGSSLRMPSEESSSTDTASIIDLDSKISKSSFRKYSYDSENSDIPISSGRNSRVSPLLDAPVALSTLKFKSLLNNNSDWNNRRKSYSFEDTSPITETIMHSNDTLAMESSTDSGICKSTEIVNDNVDDNKHKLFKSREEPGMNGFQNWLANNRQNNRYTDSKFKPYRDRETINEDHDENKITLQSTGKVSITLPIAIETDEGYVYRNNQMNDDAHRKVKKVEFCKTELHFAVDTGRVNIIATDDKPPPSNDFRKRRSAFVPLRDISEKPITLFGEKSNDLLNDDMDSYIYKMNDLNENDENTAATKSILKNKIPKPKPYLLGENMGFGIQKDCNVDEDTEDVPTGVSLINKQLQSDKWGEGEITKISQKETSSLKHNSFQTINQGLFHKKLLQEDTYSSRNVRHKIEATNDITSPQKAHVFKRSPTPGRIKTRELRESDLTYFGVPSQQSETIGVSSQSKPQVKQERTRETLQDSTNMFQSVKLIQQVSNSVCNSESEDSPEYQNIPFNKHYVPKPKPRIRSKFDDKPNQVDEIKVMKPIIERAKEVRMDDSSLTRRSKLRKQEEFKSFTNRSRSEPRKSYNSNYIDKNHRKDDQTQRSTENSLKRNSDKSKPTVKKIEKGISNDDIPVYENLNKYVIKNAHGSHPKPTSSNNTYLKDSLKRSNSNKTTRKRDVTNYDTDTKTRKNNIENSDIKKEVAQKSKTVDNKNNKSDDSRNSSIIIKNSESVNAKTSHKTIEPSSTHTNDSLSNRKEHKSRSHKKEHKTEVTGGKSLDRADKVKSTSGKDKNDQNSDNQIHVRHSSKDKTSSKNESITIMPKVEKYSSLNKPPSRESARPRSKRKEYVINYDDKKGTVSSITKIEPNSGSPIRKPTRDIVKERYKENLKKKSSDKVALRK